ncbi:hypothetical protein N0V90_006344 [Kalmusia sp. IMI 367209]|nr:hypothetical protein N0V90_006344 [Kalmusia sp. IMI 367209]
MESGGPSASGIEALINNGERLQHMVDAQRKPMPDPLHESIKAQYFDIISFDPRGVNHSVPQLNCFPDTFSRLVWSLGSDAKGLIGSSSTAFDEKWSRYLSRSNTCMIRVEEEGSKSIAYYMGTRSVVDDIVAIAEQHGKWREAEARKLLHDKCALPSGLDRKQILDNTRWRPGKEPVLFWGTSYGTILGSTLAAVYPDRPYRMVLDSVASTKSFFNGSSQGSLNHADEVLVQFVRLCHKYGPKVCKFYRNTEEAIARDRDSLLADLHAAPLAVPATLTRGPDSITLTDMQKFIGNALYRPHQLFYRLGEFLQQVSEGNGSRFADFKATIKSISVPDAQADLYTLSPECKKDGPYSPACTRPNEWLEESMLGISCGDGTSYVNMTKDRFRSYWNDMRNQSHALGDVWTEWDLMCVGWTIETKRKYVGPVSSDSSQPILFVGNTLDPLNANTAIRASRAVLPRQGVKCRLKCMGLLKGMLTKAVNTIEYHLTEVTIENLAVFNAEHLDLKLLKILQAKEFLGQRYISVRERWTLEKKTFLGLKWGQESLCSLFCRRVFDDYLHDDRQEFKRIHETFTSVLEVLAPLVEKMQAVLDDQDGWTEYELVISHALVEDMPDHSRDCAEVELVLEENHKMRILLEEEREIAEVFLDLPSADREKDSEPIVETCHVKPNLEDFGKDSDCPCGLCSARVRTRDATSQYL